jgi:hypothetical protein
MEPKKRGEITDKWKQEIEAADTSYLYCAPACRSVSTARHTPKKLSRVHERWKGNTLKIEEK